MRKSLLQEGKVYTPEGLRIYKRTVEYCVTWRGSVLCIGVVPANCTQNKGFVEGLMRLGPPTGPSYSIHLQETYVACPQNLIARMFLEVMKVSAGIRRKIGLPQRTQYEKALDALLDSFYKSIVYSKYTKPRVGR